MEAPPLPTGLYILATPIGNLKDISLRALNTLAAADVIFAEDTRVTRILLTHYGIKTPLVAYHEHNEISVTEKAIERLKSGQSVVLVSDAGTPLVSDPGFKLVQAALSQNLPVTSLPGPSAAINALVLSGLPSDRFFFEGFLPPKSTARQERMKVLSVIPSTLIFYESPHRLSAMLEDAARVFGARSAVVARELTKLYETVYRDTLPALAELFLKNGPPKGEVVVLIGPASGEIAFDATDETLDQVLRQALQKFSIKDAAALAASQTKCSKREAYARAIILAQEK